MQLHFNEIKCKVPFEEFQPNSVIWCLFHCGSLTFDEFSQLFSGLYCYLIIVSTIMDNGIYFYKSYSEQSWGLKSSIRDYSVQCIIAAFVFILLAQGRIQQFTEREVGSQPIKKLGKKGWGGGGWVSNNMSPLWNLKKLIVKKEGVSTHEILPLDPLL